MFQYYQELKLKPDSEFLTTSVVNGTPVTAGPDLNPGYYTNFMNYVCICSQLPNLIINMIGMFSDKGNLLIRIVVSLCIVAASTLFTIIFIFVDTSDCKLQYIR